MELKWCIFWFHFTKYLPISLRSLQKLPFSNNNKIDAFYCLENAFSSFTQYLISSHNSAIVFELVAWPFFSLHLIPTLMYKSAYTILDDKLFHIFFSSIKTYHHQHSSWKCFFHSIHPSSCSWCNQNCISLNCLEKSIFIILHLK